MMIGTRSSWRMMALPGETEDDIRASCERVMDALLDIEEQEKRVHSAAVSLDLGKMTLEVELAVDADSVEDAVVLVDDANARALAIAGHHPATEEDLANAPQLVRKSAEVLEPA